MKKISLALMLCLSTLSGCADKKEQSSAQNIENDATAEPIDVTQAGTEEIAVAEEVVQQEEAEQEAIVEEENPPKFAQITDYLALKPNMDWQWDYLTKIPNIQKWHNKVPARNEYNPEDPTYSIRGQINDYGAVVAYGTKAQPNLIIIGSAQGVAEDETTSAVYELSDLFRERELTHLSSNCDKGDDNFLFTQHFYKWQKSGYQPLYIYEIRDIANAGTTTEFGIAQSLDEFFKPEYEHIMLLIDNYDEQFNKIVCTFDE